ncbi:hypothetical protein GCM10009789_37750 [Kribbella sancticallisti]|uniref:Antirestriction protein ArdC n=1 Tax=Kribbella sancticallisti TaxID=460087 RepID=A0ABN2DMG6_9ACTN
MGKERVRAEDLHRVLDADVGKLKSGSDWARWLDAAALFPTYGFGNVVLINLQMPQASWVAGAQVWEKLGRRVNAGQAIRILAPLRSWTAVAAGSDAAGRTQGVEGRVIGFRVNAVYDVTATVGPPIYLPRPPVDQDRTTAGVLWEALVREAAAGGFAVDVRATGDASEGFTDYEARRIVVADHLDDFRAAARLAHEVGHARMHSPAGTEEAGRLMCRGLRGIEAASAAYVVLAHHGLGVDTDSFDHITGWAKLVNPNDPAAVLKATGARVVNTARQLIAATDKHVDAQRTPLGPVPARPLDSAFLAPDLDGPAL